MPDDSQLLTLFIRNRDHRAFALLVERHISMVYTAARRQLRDDHLAEEVTQKVFILLAQNAPRIRSGAILPGWLVNAARYYGLAALRSQRRRKHHESQVPPMQPPAQKLSSDSDAIEPLLSDALASLTALDRSAITLRYLEGKTIPDLAAAMHISTAAAEKRVSRALDRLRKFFSRRGKSFSALGLAATLSSLTVHHAPPALAASITAAAAKTSTTLTLKGALTLMAISKTKSLLIAAVLLLLAASATLVTIKLTASSSSSTPPIADNSAPSPETPPPAASSLHPISITFSDGTTVHLLALQTEPFGDDNWWAPDGSRSLAPPHRPNPSFHVSNPAMQSVRMVFQVDADPSKQTGVTVQFPQNGPVSISVYDGPSYRMAEVTAAFLSSLPSTSAAVGIAAGEWKTQLTYDPASAAFTSPPNPTLQLPTITLTDQVHQTTIDITPNPRNTELTQDRWVIIAKGKTLIPTRNSSTNSRRTLTFPCPLSVITQLLYQTRPYEFQTFKNIALAPKQ